MSISNACQAIAKWIGEYDSTAEGRDPNAFMGGAIYVAAADGPVDDGERALLITLTSALAQTDYDEDTVTAEIARISELGAEGHIEEIAGAVPNQDERGLLVSFAALLACVERGVNAQEGTAIQALGQGLGFTHNEVLQLLGNAMTAAAHG